MTTYSKETALYDTGAIANGISEAGETASKYLTVVSGTTGISVHNENDNKNFVNMNADDGVTVYRDIDGTATDVANFGETTRIGIEGTSNLEITSSGIVGHSEGYEKFKINMDGEEVPTEVRYPKGSGFYVPDVKNNDRAFYSGHMTVETEESSLPSEIGTNDFHFHFFNTSIVLMTTSDIEFKRWSGNSSKRITKRYIYTMPDVVDFVNDGSAQSYTYSSYDPLWLMSNGSEVFSAKIQYTISYNNYKITQSLTLFDITGTIPSDLGRNMVVNLGYTLSTDATIHAPSYVLGTARDKPGSFSTLIGKELLAYDNQIVLGNYNEPCTPTGLLDDKILIIGNGTATTYSNALTVDKTGDMHIQLNFPIDADIYICATQFGWESDVLEDLGSM